jgi:thiol-disulfide isomerase/thioredoxin
MNNTSQDNMTKQSGFSQNYVYIAVAAAIVVLVGGLIVNSSNQSNSTQAKNSSSSSVDSAMKQKDDEAMAMKKKEEESAMMKKKDEEAAMKKETSSSSTAEIIKKDEVMSQKGSYTAYKPELLANAEKGNVVLFFHASWCPTCKAAEADILSKTVNDGLTILKIDYDNSTELKQKYGVTSQSTFVKVDKDGKLLSKGTSFTTLEDITKFASK